MGEKIAVRTIWTRGCLIPFWVIQIIIIIIQVAVDGIFLTFLGALKATDGATGICYDAQIGDYYCGISLTDSEKKAINTALGVTAVVLVIMIIAFCMEIFQIVQYCRSRLTPSSYFYQQLFFIIVFTISLILSIVAVAQRQGGVVQLVLTILVWLAFLASFIYAIVISTRNKKGRYNKHDTELHQHNGGEYKNDSAPVYNNRNYEVQPQQQYPTYEQPQHHNAPEVNHGQYTQQTEYQQHQAPPQGGAPPYPVHNQQQY